MRKTTIIKRLKAYYVTAIFSILFALIGFSYNLWRMEVTERNNTQRTASFEMLKELAELEQVIYAAHYDKDSVQGSPRIGWVKVGLVTDLSGIMAEEVNNEVLKLHSVWSDNWDEIKNNRDATNLVVAQIDSVRKEIRTVIKNLK